MYANVWPNARGHTVYMVYKQKKAKCATMTINIIGAVGKIEERVDFA